MLTEQLGSGFKPYALEQVHGTIIGLEGARVGTHIHNENFRRLRGTERLIDFRGLLHFLRIWAEPDWNVRLGGFEDGREVCERRDRDVRLPAEGVEPGARAVDPGRAHAGRGGADDVDADEFDAVEHSMRQAPNLFR